MRSLRRIAGTLLLASLVPAAILAQSADAWRDSATSLGHAIQALGDSMIKGDSSAIEFGRRGDLIVAASPGLRDMALEGLDRVSQLRRRWFGNARLASDGFRLVVRVVTHGRLNGQEKREGVVILSSLPDTGKAVHGEVTADRADVAFQMANQYFRMMFWGAPDAIAHWLSGPPNLWESEKDRRDQTMYALVTGMGLAQRECLNEQFAGCARALGLGALQPADSGRMFYPPVRADLMLAALEIGGGEAWQRAMNNRDETAEEALVAAAGMPIDSLFARWRDGLLVRRPNAPPISGAGVLLAVAWAVAAVLGVVGATRWA